MPHVQPEAPSASAAILELLSWISARPRTYGETMEVWRTSCPRSSTWEDATVGGFVEVSSERDVGMRESIVRLTRAGRAILAADGPVSEGHR
jgi:hypothetical protein